VSPNQNDGSSGAWQGPSITAFAFLVLVILVGGAVIGAVVYAITWPGLPQVDTTIRTVAIAPLIPVLTGAFAVIAAYWGGTVAANGARAAARTSARAIEHQGQLTSDENARQAVTAQKQELVRRIAVLADRHAQEVSNQFMRWNEAQGTPTQPEPRVGSTEPIEDAVNELYVLGAQETADRARWLLMLLVEYLDRLVFDAKKDVDEAGIVAMLPPEKVHHHAVVRLAGTMIKTDMMRAHQIDVGLPPLPDKGSVPDDYIDQIFAQAAAKLR